MVNYKKQFTTPPPENTFIGPKSTAVGAEFYNLSTGCHSTSLTTSKEFLLGILEISELYTHVQSSHGKNIRLLTIYDNKFSDFNICD